MNKEKLFQLLDQGEGFTVEYKSCKNSLSKSVFETVCSFSNRYGGYILLGVEETTKDGRKVGEIVGVNENCIYDMQRNFITTLNDLNFFVPSIYISLEKFCIDGKTILYCYVPFSSQLTRCNGRVFDRNGDADIDITKSTDLVANVLNRKSNSFKERQILPYVNDDDLELDLLDTVRKMTLIKKDHPWQSMNDKELLRSAEREIFDSSSNPLTAWDGDDMKKLFSPYFSYISSVELTQTEEKVLDEQTLNLWLEKRYLKVLEQQGQYSEKLKPIVLNELKNKIVKWKHVVIVITLSNKVIKEEKTETSPEWIEIHKKLGKIT